VRETTSDVASTPAAGVAGRETIVKLATVGVSLGTPCGVHDHAQRLAESLAQQGFSSALHWLWRSEAPFAASRAEIGQWTKQLASELEREEPGALLLHYSVFAYSYRGLPVFVRPVLAVARKLGLPTVALLHEYAYPWHRQGVRGKAWALSHRLLLRDVMRACSAVAVTTDFRADWLSTRAWLPRRPMALAPVYSSLPAADAGAAPARERPLIGLFGYAHEGVVKAVVLDALRSLQDRGVDVELLLAGAPGRSSAAGESWLAGARRRGLLRDPVFSGMLPAQELSNTLSGCAVLLSADNIGPTSRRTTLAASLAAGAPVVALDGRHSWQELRDSEAALLVEPTAGALAGALAELLEDAERRAQLARRGREFASSAMSAERSARAVGGLLRGLSAPTRAAAPSLLAHS
jgi:glycosyltransferase involved in cell wall biosynthesis